MKSHNINREITKNLSGSLASFLSGSLYFIPNRLFMPKELHHTACEGKNLQYVGAQIDNLPGGSIAFDRKSAILSTVGEFAERYSASFQSEHQHLLYKDITYNELSQIENVVEFKYLKYYQDDQYQGDFPYTRITEDTPIDWVEGFCFIQQKKIFFPAELVFLPYRVTNQQHYWAQTSTGLSAHINDLLSMTGGYLECEERNAFSNWWYKQNKIKLIKYSQETILENFLSEEIRILYKNNRVKIDIYDLGEFSNVETMVCFIQFEYKNKPYITIGCSSRFNKEEALIKACLEAYQGIDFAILLCNKENWIDDAEHDFSKLDEFDKHFAYYNKYPDIREKVPIYIDLLKGDHTYAQEIVYFDNKVASFSRAEFLNKAKNISHILSFDLTTTDIHDCGYKVFRTVIPGFHLLTGNHNTPFLGFFEPEELFTYFPHPFP